MSPSLRVALLLNPLTLQVKGGDHAPALARELLGLGYTVRGFGAPPGAIPRSGPEPQVDGGVLPEEGPGPLGFHPDVVVAYTGASPAAWLGARVARKLGIPLVLVESGFSASVRRTERFLHRVGGTLWGRSVRAATRAVVALDPVAAEQAKREGFAEERIRLLPAGVDLSLFRPGLASRLVGVHQIRGHILLHAGRLMGGRGLESLIAAFAATVGQRRDWTLVFAGDGPARPGLRAMVERLGVGDRVHWLPRPRPEELPGLMGASTLLVVPAQDDLVRGKNIPGALACGLPVIAADRPRLRFLVDDTQTGLLVPPGDVAAWAEALRTGCGDPAARKRWSARAREVAEERFAWPHVAERFGALLHKLCAPRGAHLVAGFEVEEDEGPAAAAASGNGESA